MCKTDKEFLSQENIVSLEQLGHLIEYYEAFEMLLKIPRSFNECRTHFGLLDNPVKGYDFFKSISQCHLYPEMTKLVRASMDKLHEKIFQVCHPNVPDYKVLDVGFGSGGTINQLQNDWKECEFYGINLNPYQYTTAKNFLAQYANVNLIIGDFLEYEFMHKFNLIYFLESAFHIMDKKQLCSKVANICDKGASIILVDIFFSSDRLSRRMANKPANNNIFSYLTIDQWKRLFKDVNIGFISFEDLSLPVANHITIRISLEEFERDFVEPLLRNNPRKENLSRMLFEAYTGYSKLHQFLKKGLLKYGIMRLERIS